MLLGVQPGTTFDMFSRVIGLKIFQKRIILAMGYACSLCGASHLKHCKIGMAACSSDFEAREYYRELQ